MRDQSVPLIENLITPELNILGNKGTGLTGNQQVNRLTGNSGNNVLTGKGGNDILDGGAGNDTAVFSGVSSQYTIVKFGNTATVTDKVNNRDGIDTLTNINLLIFSDTSLTSQNHGLSKALIMLSLSAAK